MLMTMKSFVMTLALAGVAGVAADQQQQDKRKLDLIFTDPPSTAPSSGPPPQCGAYTSLDGFTALGPYEDSDSFECNTNYKEDENWFITSYKKPAYAYTFSLSQDCKYKYKAPETMLQWQELNDVTHWFDQAARSFENADNEAYRVPNGYVFSGTAIPDMSTEVSTEVEGCPLAHCVEIVGESVMVDTTVETTVSGGSSLIYAFSTVSARMEFMRMLSDATGNSNSNKIFLTNNFVRCGCKPICMDDEDPLDGIEFDATCYVEEYCGVSVFQIGYRNAYPEEQKASWANTGTTEVLAWFSECAKAMYGCALSDSSDITKFIGMGYDTSRNFPRARSSSTSYYMTDAYGGFSGASRGTRNVKRMEWKCPSRDHKDALESFAEIVADAEHMRDSGVGTIIPSQCDRPCTNPEPFVPPQPDPACEGVDHAGYCHEFSGGTTCYIRKPQEYCAEVEFVAQTGDAIEGVYDNVFDWWADCVMYGTQCFDIGFSEEDFDTSQPPEVDVSYNEDDGWGYAVKGWVDGSVMELGQEVCDGESSYDAYNIKNFTEGAAGVFPRIYGNTFGNLFEVRPKECTESPTGLPSASPSLSLFPTSAPTESKLCKESYLQSDSLNIALVVDLSFSTYEDEFSSSVNIGDFNGDGKSNTILDAEVRAIEDLLTAISESDTLDNSNCEIELISFSTDATSHGVWQPLDAYGGPNMALMKKIKLDLRAPTREEVQTLNLGYTNFDQALDRAAEYYEERATRGRKNLLVFLSDGVPNVRGDGDEEGYCTEYDGPVNCNDLSIGPGEPNTICFGGDTTCSTSPYRQCIRGPTYCEDSTAVTQYDSEIARLTVYDVQRLAIGIGTKSDVSEDSALWMIDDNPGKYNGILPLQALNVDALSNALRHLCILNTDPPTISPSMVPSVTPTESPGPSSIPTGAPSLSPTNTPSFSPTPIKFRITDSPTLSPTKEPTKDPTQVPTANPTLTPTTADPTYSPTKVPTHYPTAVPTHVPTASPTLSPSQDPTLSPTAVPTTTPSLSPSGSFYPSSGPTETPTKSPSPSMSPTGEPSDSPTLVPTLTPTSPPTSTPTATPTMVPTADPTSTPTFNPTHSPTPVPTSLPTSSPTLQPSISGAPTFLLPDCYHGPKMVQKDSTSIPMCHYNQDMVQINRMSSENVTVAVNNVWSRYALPRQMRIFVHSNGVNSVMKGGDGFQCTNDYGSDIDIESHNEFVVQCYKEDDFSPSLAVIDVVITDDVISGKNDVNHPCFPDLDPIEQSCSWRIIVPCSDDLMCTNEPTVSPTSNPTDGPTANPTLSPTVDPTAVPTLSPTVDPTANPTAVPTLTPTVDPTAVPTVSPTAVPTLTPTVDPTAVPTVSPTASTKAPARTYDDTKKPTIYIPPQEGSSCPEDIVILNTEGVTDYPPDTVQILAQDTSTVTVRLSQKFSPQGSVDSVFYQYQKTVFDSKCYQVNDMDISKSKDITIQCTTESQIALLEIWVADALSNGILLEQDNAVIPKCCKPPEDINGSPVVKYFIEIKCVSVCVDQVVY